MPNSLEAAAIFAVIVVPGFLLTRGYRRTRAHGLPSRDLYVLAEAIVGSLAWLPVLWLLFGSTLLGWIERETLIQHQLEVMGIVFLNLVTSYTTGLLAGNAVNWLGDRPGSWLAGKVAWTGIFEPPTAWDAAWLSVVAAEWTLVELQLQSDERLYVGFDQDSQVDLSPKSTRYLFFDTEYRSGDDGSWEALDHEGVWVDGAEIVAIRFLQEESE